MYYVYKIKCIVNGNVYVGQTNNIDNRWNTHKYELSNNKHRNRRLQNDYNTFGLSNFTFNIIETATTRQQALQQETYWINYYGGIESYNVYNEHNNIHQSKTMRHNVSVSLQGDKNGFYGKHHTQEFKLAHSKRMTGDNNPAKRPEVRKKISEANTGHTASDYVKKLISERQKGDNNVAKRPEVRKKISEARKGQPSPRKGYRKYSEKLAYQLKCEYKDVKSYKLVAKNHPELTIFTVTNLIKNY